MTQKKQQALAYFQQNRLTEAKAAYTGICERDKHDADAWFMLGIIHGQLGALPEAEKCNRRVIELQPASFAAMDNLGIALMLQGKYTAAAECFRKALAIKPDYAQALNHLGNISREQGKPKEAVEFYQKALRINPDYAEAHNNLGSIYQGRCQYTQAAEEYRHALRLDPNYLDAYFNMGTVLQNKGHYDEATGYYRKSLELRPGFIEAITGIADIHEKRGEFELALLQLQPLLELQQVPPRVAITFGTLCRRLERHEQGRKLLEDLLETRLPPISRQDTLYALGDIHNDLEHYDSAFEYYQKANELRPYPATPESGADYMQAIRNTFSQATMANMPRAANPSGQPVFIVGMPRSGTSLVEQIIASHSKVHGAGELPYVGDMLGKLQTLTGHDIYYPGGTPELTQADLSSLSGYYLDKIKSLAPDALRITDKMPHNFLHLGLLELLFPNARVIHCRRDPVDTCLSIYFYNFNANHPYATSLEQLGIYYRHYEQLMEHWRSTLDISLIEVDYEELVNNQETVSRGLVKFCGLEWEPECLNFHETRRTVSTPSYHQVRQPVYKTAIKRWQHYEQHLGPLFEALKKPAPTTTDNRHRS